MAGQYLTSRNLAPGPIACFPGNGGFPGQEPVPLKTMQEFAGSCCQKSQVGGEGSGFGLRILCGGQLRARGERLWSKAVSLPSFLFCRYCNYCYYQIKVNHSGEGKVLEGKSPKVYQRFFLGDEIFQKFLLWKIVDIHRNRKIR